MREMRNLSELLKALFCADRKGKISALNCRIINLDDRLVSRVGKKLINLTK